jgi:two-component system response regulator YesN
MDTPRPLRVLLVEDDPVMGRLLRSMLWTDAAVRVVTTGEEALCALARESVETVVTDLRLGGVFDGIALSRCIRARWPTTRIVLLMGWTKADILRQAEAVEVDQLLVKPFPADALIQALRPECAWTAPGPGAPE